MENIKISAGINQQTLERLAHYMGICLYKLNLNTKDINLTINTTRITGYDLTDLPTNDNTKESMVFEGDRQLVDNSIASIISGQRDHYHIEYRMRRKDSSIAWIKEVGMISEYDNDGNPLYMSAIAIDLSRLRWAEERARNMEKEARRFAISRNADSFAEESRLLRAANAAAAIIIGGFHQDYEVVLHQSLQMLGESINANCVCLWRNDENNDVMSFFLRAYWTEGAHSFGTENNKLKFQYDFLLPNWQSELSEFQFVSLAGNKLPKDFLHVYGLENSKNIMFIPLYLHGDFWGMIGFGREDNMPFVEYEFQAMLSGAIIIASTVSRNETLGKINTDRDKAVANTLAKGEFLSRMSHELRTPLNAIIGMTDIALREKDTKRIFDHLKKIESSSQLLLNIINDVLDISKIDAGKLEVVKEPFDLNNMLSTAANIVKVKMDQKRQKFTINCDEMITCKIISDEHRLLQVIVNLLSNAMKFTPEGGEISLKSFQQKIGDNHARLHVEVLDNGIGLTAIQQKGLFTAFEQADGSITRKYGGTGLGLAICKKILNALGGDIWVKSKPEKGSCFFFELDVELGEPLKNNETTNELSGGNNNDDYNDNDNYDWSDYTILLAEDIEINKEIVEIMLSETGVKITYAQNGKEAVDSFCSNPGLYDLILMDIQMPVLDGLSATKQIRSSGLKYAKQIPIIAMTANAFKEDIEVCLGAGMNDHLAKPMTIDTLFNVLKKYFTNKGQHNE